MDKGDRISRKYNRRRMADATSRFTGIRER